MKENTRFVALPLVFNGLQDEKSYGLKVGKRAGQGLAAYLRLTWRKIILKINY